MGFAGKPSRSQLARQSSAAQISDQTSRSGQRWVDQDFKDDAALYGRTRSHNFNNGNPIKWFRPHELKDLHKNKHITTVAQSLRNHPLDGPGTRTRRTKHTH